MNTVIMAGGMGTRMSELYPDIPKPMIPIGGIPVLEREIKSLVSQGFRDIIITVSYKGEKIADYFKNGNTIGANISYFMEEVPLGNAGALFKLRSKLTEPFLLINADSVFDVDFNRMVQFHKSKGGWVTLFVHPNSHPFDSSIIITDEKLSVQEWISAEDRRPQYYKNRVNAGLHIIDPQVLDFTNIDASIIGKVNQDGKINKIDLDRQILKPLSGTGKMFCYESPEYVKDMGTPERFAQVQVDFKNGIVEGKNLSKKQRAVFFDRDGTINIYKGFLKDVNDFELVPGIADVIKQVINTGYLVIVVTNQPIIARGEITYKQLFEIHNKMETLLGEEGAYVDSIYFCPHHPHRGYIGEIPELKVYCDCRKPKPGMLIKASEDYNIDLEKSIMVGDSKIDIDAGKAAGCKTILIGSGDFKQDYSVNSMDELSKQLGVLFSLTNRLNI